MLFKQKDPKTEIEGLDKALEILNEKYQKNLIKIEKFNKKSILFGKRRAKYLKKLAQQENKR